MSLATAIDALYETFAGYEAPLVLVDCPCCENQEDQPAVHSGPVRKLKAKALEFYIDTTDLYWSDSQDFRHFLPRMLDLATQDALGTNLEILGGKLRREGWETGWPPTERAAVGNFLQAWWSHTLASPSPHWPSAETCLTTIGKATDTLAPYLALWAQEIAGPPLWNAPDGLAPVLAGPHDPGLAPTLADGRPPVPLMPHALYHFAAFMEFGWNAQGPDLTNGFWPPEPKRQVLAWLGSAELQQALRRAFQRTWDTPDFEVHARLFDPIAWLL